MDMPVLWQWWPNHWFGRYSWRVFQETQGQWFGVGNSRHSSSLVAILAAEYCPDSLKEWCHSSRPFRRWSKASHLSVCTRQQDFQYHEESDVLADYICWQIMFFCEYVHIHRIL